MGSASNLLDFVTWAKRLSADRYAWSFGSRQRMKRSPSAITRGVSYTMKTGNHIDTWDCRKRWAMA